MHMCGGGLQQLVVISDEIYRNMVRYLHGAAGGGATSLVSLDAPTSRLVCSSVFSLLQCFSGHDFHSMGELSVNVPVLVIGGMAKEFLVPGWRVGWILIHDRHNAFANVRKGLFNVTTLTMGTPTPLQVKNLPPSAVFCASLCVCVCV